jgi:predicted NBD/HSP70 family sugar kinase
MSSRSTSSRTSPSATVKSSQQVRGVNSVVVLDALWDSSSEHGLTGAELREITGLSRATVLAICDGLRESDWLLEDRAPSVVPGRGRQARRFAFNADRGYVVGADIGLNSVTAVVADLAGGIRGRVRHRTDQSDPDVDRTGELLRSLGELLDSTGIDGEQIVAGCIGVAASVDPDGTPAPGNDFWENFRLDLPRLRETAPWPLSVENDANLAALAEFHAVPGDSPSPFVTMLSGDRFGAGVVVGGLLLRGAHGNAGEMAYLERVRGIEHPLGLLPVTRELIEKAEAAGRETSLRRDPQSVEDTAFEEAFVALDGGDIVAQEIVDELAERLALTVSSFALFVDPARVVIAGGVAELVERLLPAVRERLAELMPVVPEIVASHLGRDVVVVGAVRNAIEMVRAQSLSS